MSYEKATTKQIKQALQSHFDYKFSVRQGRGTAHHWISVRWTDGPTQEAVRLFCGKYNDSANDDIITDLWCGSQYTTVSRSYSEKYCFLLNNLLDLRTPPTLQAQIYNYYTLLIRRHGPAANIKFSRVKNHFEIETDDARWLDNADIVEKCLTQQGYKVDRLADGKRFCVSK
ncbi:MAG: hypothetical protein AMJ75_00445 [Phycisphaerae bacterium SM1_79]|nr:MAG: hypothetical protein AMJ75_00445 [Phycisphaerae bacterium SM1_79]